MSNNNKKDYYIYIETFKIQQENVYIIKYRMQRIYTAIIESARAYIPITKKTETKCKIIKFL